MKIDPDGLVILLVVMTALGFFFGWVFATFKTKWMLIDHKTEIRNLSDLVVHCWVHSGYQNCGYKQMTTRQKEFYDETIRSIDCG